MAEIKTEQEQEFEEAEKEAAEEPSSLYVHKFKKPFKWQGQEYTELHFDFESLTGEDSLNIEAELQSRGTMVMVPAFSGPYLIGMSARACQEKLGTDAFRKMPINDFVRIRTRARNFLMTSEQ